MKKIVLIAAFAVFGFTQVNAQEGNFKVGAFFGLPMGDFSDSHSFNVGLDVAYLFDIADSFQVGPATGYSHSFGKSYSYQEFDPGTMSIVDVEDNYDAFQFVPIAAAARFNLDQFYFGADLGYAIGLNDGNKGGIYYRPKAGYNFGPLAAFLSYTGVSSKQDVTVIVGPISTTESVTTTFGSVNVGVEFGF